jgi:preprotein translocase subunit SecE
VPHKRSIKAMKIKAYLQEVYTELIHKVSWPTWKDLQSSALIVMVASLLIALIIFFMDISFENVMEFVYQMMY